ncbi:MAG: class I SAM-dependent methyltransferase [Candidatus Thorarchaeota archaeon]
MNVCEICQSYISEGTVCPVRLSDEKTYILCQWCRERVINYVEGNVKGECINIAWFSPHVSLSWWETTRDFIRKHEITEVLEYGTGLSTELFYNEGLKVTSLDSLFSHHALYGRNLRKCAEYIWYKNGRELPDLSESHPGRKWRFVFVDGGRKRRTLEVKHAMKYCSEFLMAHDLYLGGEKELREEGWEEVEHKIWQRGGIKFPESCWKYVDLQCKESFGCYNNCLELKCVEKILNTLEPTNILDLGSGIGRASVFLHKKYNWSNANFHLFDGDSGDRTISGFHNNSEDKFYNSLSVAEEFCVLNGIEFEHLILLNAEEVSLASIEERFDMCVSLKSFGFHWPIHGALSVLATKMEKGAYLFFEIRREEGKVDKVDSTKYDVIGIFPILQGNSSMLVLRRV